MRIHLLEAEDLTAKDTVIKGLIDGKSDPYAILRVGTQIFTSHHVDSNLNPQWREMFEVRRGWEERKYIRNKAEGNSEINGLIFKHCTSHQLCAKSYSLLSLSLLRIDCLGKSLAVNKSLHRVKQFCGDFICCCVSRKPLFPR